MVSVCDDVGVGSCVVVPVVVDVVASEDWFVCSPDSSSISMAVDLVVLAAEL